MVKRNLYKDLKQHLAKKEITLIVGARQAGKTTLMLLLKKHLEKMGKKTVFLNLDIELDKRFFTSQESLIRKIQLEIGKEGYVFIDEIQRKENAGLFLKGLYDMGLEYKFIVSGSGSMELKEKIHESLVGRKRLFELSTVSFEEFVNFKTEYRYENRLHEFFSIESEKTLSLLNEYLNYGGYPRVIMAENSTEKELVIGEIYSSYIEKDISYLLNVEKTEEFSNLVRILAKQSGMLVNLSELSSTIGISIKTLKNYMWYLEKTYIVKKVTPFFKNPRKEITKSPVVYFSDLGLRNYSLGVLGIIERTHDIGFVFQNFIFCLLNEKIPASAKLHYWRTKDGSEVDFVVNFNRKQLPVEVKYQYTKEAKISRPLRSFVAKYKSPYAAVINLSLEKNVQTDNIEVKFLPFYKIHFLDTSFRT